MTQTKAAKPMVKQYLNVAYEDRDMAKRLGARWDPSVRRWYCPKGSTLAKVFAWRNASTAQIQSHTQMQSHTQPPRTPPQMIPATNQNFELPLAG